MHAMISRTPARLLGQFATDTTRAAIILIVDEGMAEILLGALQRRFK
jgi:hypothetical protein